MTHFKILAVFQFLFLAATLGPANFVKAQQLQSRLLGKWRIDTKETAALGGRSAKEIQQAREQGITSTLYEFTKDGVLAIRQRVKMKDVEHPAGTWKFVGEESKFKKLELEFTIQKDTFAVVLEFLSDDLIEFRVTEPAAGRLPKIILRRVLPVDSPNGEARLENHRQVFPTGDEAWRFDRRTFWPLVRLDPEGRQLLYLRRAEGGFQLTLRHLQQETDRPISLPLVNSDLASIYPRLNPFCPTGRRMVLSSFDVSADRFGSNVFLWDLMDQKPGKIKQSEEIVFAKFDRTGNALIVNADDEMSLVSLPDLKKESLGIGSANFSVCPTADVVCWYRRESLILFDLEVKETTATLPLDDDSQLDDLETRWTQDGRFVYYVDGNKVRVWDRIVGKPAGQIEARFPVGPGPVPTTMLLSNSWRDKKLEQTIILHDALNGQQWSLGDADWEPQSAEGNKIVYLKHAEDGSATLHTAEIVLER